MGLAATGGRLAAIFVEMVAWLVIRGSDESIRYAPRQHMSVFSLSETEQACPHKPENNPQAFRRLFQQGNHITPVIQRCNNHVTAM
jgi:hypothetical protein